jgi:hypothetical protein
VYRTGTERELDACAGVAPSGRPTAMALAATRYGAQWLGNFMGQGYFGVEMTNSHLSWRWSLLS